MSMQHITSLLLLLSISWPLTQGQPTSHEKKDYSLVTDIADHYVRSFDSQASEQKEEELATLKKHLQEPAHHVRPATLDAATIRKTLFNQILAKSNRLSFIQQTMEPMLNEYAWGDLKLFYGTTTAPGYNFISRINKTTTVLGEAALSTLLVTPTSDLTVLRERQSILQALLNDHALLLKQLQEPLRIYQQAEQSMISFWTTTDPLYTKEYITYMENKFYAKNDEAANKSASWLEFKKRFFRDFWSIQYRFIYPITSPTIREIVAASQGKGIISPSMRKDMWIDSIPYYGGWNRCNELYQHSKAMGDKSSNVGMYFLHMLPEVAYTWIAYIGIQNYLEYASVLRNLAHRMADVQAFIITATQLSKKVAAVPTLESIYGKHLTATRQLLACSEEGTELGKLIQYLQELPLSNWSYFFNNAGKLLAGHKLFIEYKEAFADAMYEIGLLDAYLSFATLMQEAATYNDNHQYVFVQFLDRTEKPQPYLKIEDMWNCFLDSKQAVGNSITMDASAGGTSNVILTGPNAGGKSTFLTGVTNMLLLAHVMGIGPAKEVVLTPFNRINTYIDIVDDIAAGKSLFMAEVDRAQKHIKILKSLQPQEFSFTIFDEPFSGTNPVEGAAAEYSILEALAEYRNSFTIVATHYPTVMLLEERAKNKGFANYKVYITREEGRRKLNYTYKIIPGRSTQAIAIDILEEQGYDLKMLERAREIINHPERYRANF
eukprot:gene2959-3692_t